MRLLKLVILLFFSSVHLHADNYIIEKFGKNKKKFLIKGETKFPYAKGDTLTSSEDCTFSVYKIGKRKAVLKVENCQDTSIYEVGDKMAFSEGKEVTIEEPQETLQQTQEWTTSRRYIVEGFRVELIKSFLSGSLEISGNVNGTTLQNRSEGDVDQTIGLAAGYAYVPIKKIGYQGRFLYTIFDDGGGDSSSSSPTSIRLDANGTYGLNHSFYLFAGLNYHKYIGGEVIEELSSGLGFQGGVSYQINPNIGVSLAYSVVNNGFEESLSDELFGNTNIDLDLSVSGLETSVYYSF